MKETVTPSELYSHMGEYLGRIRWGGDTFTVKKHGRSIATLVSFREMTPGRSGQVRYPYPEYERATPGQFRRRMSEYLGKVQFGLGKRRVLITHRGHVVAIVKPVGKGV